MTTTVQFNQSSVRRLLKNLEQLPQRVGFRVFRIALSAWGGYVKTIAVSHARKRTGRLKKSQTTKVKIPAASYNSAHHSKPAYVVVGTSKNAVAPLVGGKKVSIRKATKAAISGRKVQIIRPSRYAHLVEHIQPFIEPAARAGEGPGYEKFKQKLEQGLAAEVAKLPK